jgi:hypothetical protein
LRQSIKADAYRGQKVQLSAFMFVPDWLAGFLTLNLLVDGENGTINQCHLHPVERTKEWEKEPWPNDKGSWGQCDVPHDSIGLTVFLKINVGPSRVPFVCIDDIGLDIIGSAAQKDSQMTSANDIERERKRVKDQYMHAPLKLVNPDFEQ